MEFNFFEACHKMLTLPFGFTLFFTTGLYSSGNFEYLCSQYEPTTYKVESWQGDRHAEMAIPLEVLSKNKKELMPFLPDGYRWKWDATQKNYELVKHTLAGSHDIVVKLFGDEKQGFDYLTIIDGQTYQSVAVKPDNQYPQKDLRNQYPMKSAQFQIVLDRTYSYVRGHLIDFDDTKVASSKQNPSTLCSENYHPEPARGGGTYSPWGQTYRRMLVANVPRQKHYVQHLFYEDNPVKLPAGHHIPLGIVFQTQDIQDHFTKYHVPWDHTIHQENLSAEKASVGWLGRLSRKHNVRVDFIDNQEERVPIFDIKEAPLPVFYDPQNANTFQNLYRKDLDLCELVNDSSDYWGRHILSVDADLEYNTLTYKYYQLLFELNHSQFKHFQYHADRFQDSYSYLLEEKYFDYLSQEQFDYLQTVFQKTDMDEEARERYLEQLEQNYNNQIDGSQIVKAPQTPPQNKFKAEPQFSSPMQSDQRSPQQDKVVIKKEVKRSLFKPKEASYEMDLKGHTKLPEKFSKEILRELKSGGILSIANIDTQKANLISQNNSMKRLDIKSQSVDVYYRKNGKKSRNDKIAAALQQLPWVRNVQEKAD